VGEAVPSSQFATRVRERAAALAGASDRPKSGPGVELEPISAAPSAHGMEYRWVRLEIGREKRVATLTVRAPDRGEPESPSALLEAGSRAWAIAADRAYMLAGGDAPATVELSPLNRGALPTSSGLSRLEARFLGEPARLGEVLSHGGPFDAEAACDTGLVTFAPDDIDWEDEVRLAVEERAAMSPDALTGMEANLRFPGPETLETKIFGRLSAWQNWIFTRPNATGEKGTLTLYGKAGQRPELDRRRT